jgi:hypothetical protein
MSILLNTNYFYMGELVHLLVLAPHYGESPYKTCWYWNSLYFYGGGQANSILTTGITVANWH